MATAPLPTEPRSSNAWARARDARLRWLLDLHPVTAAMLVTIGWFPSTNKAGKRLRRLVQKKQIRLVGTVCRNGGRPEHVYCRWLPKADQLLHEIELTELCFRLDAETIHRGPHVEDTLRGPDAEVWINGHRYCLELDRGSMRLGQIVSQRYRKYEGCLDLVLWVCPTEARRDTLRQRAESLRPIALFTTFAEALVSPHRDIWLDYQGERVALPRQGTANPVEKGA